MATKKDIAAFEKMTDAQKRVAIAKDVIAQLDAGIYMPFSNYFFIEGSPTQQLDDKSIRGTPCFVCAKGAFFVSRFGKFNGLPKMVPFEIGTRARALHRLPEFPASISRDIEQCFECYDPYKHLASVTADDRLRIIAQNIIDNKGDFKPKELIDYEVVEI